jgi:tetratricopeptide (TPR) repeat protein
VALAQACAAAGRHDEADALYARALQLLDTTWPFPAAGVWFARGLMWSEQAGDPARGAAMYEQALRLVPQHVAAGLHLAELQAARGDEAGAVARLSALVQASDEPEALALLGQLHGRAGLPQGRDEIARAGRRFEQLLQRHPAAFADHAAEFYLGAGQDPKRALAWARFNLQVRPTPRAQALLARAQAQVQAQAAEARLKAAARPDRRAAPGDRAPSRRAAGSSLPSPA